MRLLVITGCLLAAFARAAVADDSGALDVEVRNRALVKASIGVPLELDTVRLRIPAGTTLTIKLTGAGRVVPNLRLFDPSGAEVDLTGNLTASGRTVSLNAFAVSTPGLYRMDIRANGRATGTYKLYAAWNLASTETFSGATGDGGATYSFDAEAGTSIKTTLATVERTATVRAVRITGPNGFVTDFPEPRRPSSKYRGTSQPLPTTGRYQLELITDVGGREITGTLKRIPSKAKAKFDLRGAERRGAGVTRMVTRMFDADGGGVDVPNLEQDQRVSIDSSGLCLSVPAGTVPFPVVFQMRTDDDQINDPLGFAPAGVSVHFDAAGMTLAKEVRITIPYDVGAFTIGNPNSDICVLRREDATGNVFEVARNTYVVDPRAGTVAFPTPTFSSYQVFSPPMELVEVTRAGQPNDLAAAVDGSVLYLSTDVLANDLPAAAILSLTRDGELDLFAGGGFATGDGVHRLDYDFDADIGFGGAIVSGIASGPDGEFLMITGDAARTFSVAYLILTDGIVVRVAGNGTPFIDESLPSRDTGLPFCCAAAFRADGVGFLVSDSYRYPESDRVFAVFSTGSTLDSLRISTVAGGGTSDVSGSAPTETRLFEPRAVLVDSLGRILVGDRDWLVRFDLDAGTTTTLAGTNFGELDGGRTGRTLGGVGAPLRTVVLGALDDLAFAPGREDILYAADPEAGIVWRFDLERNRAFIAAGRRLTFDEAYTTREPSVNGRDPNQLLSFPVGVAPFGDEVFISEFSDDRVFSLRRRE